MTDERPDHELFTRRVKRRLWAAEPDTRAMLLHHARKRQTALRGRLPAWADLDAIAAVYREAVRRSSTSGQQFHVDHVYPLHGKTVSGLHVANNLQILPAASNLQKHSSLPINSEVWPTELPQPESRAEFGPRSRRIDSYRAMFPASIVRAKRVTR